MAIDLSLLENINFANRDNLIFLAIVFVLVIIIFSLFLFIASRIIKRIKKIFSGPSHRRTKKSEAGPEKNIQQQIDMPAQDSSRRVESFGNVGGGSATVNKKETKETKEDARQENKQKFEAKEQKEISEGLSKLKTASLGEATMESKMPSREEKEEGSKGKFYAVSSSPNSSEPRDLTGQRETDHKGIKIPTAQNFKEALTSEKVAGGEKAGTEHGYKQKFETKEKKDIATGLSKLKSAAPSKEGTVSSKMPSRGGEEQEEGDHQQINIPVSKHFKEGEYVPSKVESSQQKGSEPFEKPGFVEDKYGIHSAHSGVSKVSPQAKAEQGEPIFEKPEFEEDKYGVRDANEARITQQKNNDDSIFKGEDEVSRRKLESEMKSDPKVWQASKQVGLNMSPVERSKLVKEIFPSALGLNISKADVKTSIRRLNKKLLGATDPTEHAKIRKEVKFLRKIGGIK